MPRQSPTGSSRPKIVTPVTRVTLFERVSSGLLSTVVGLLLTVAVLAAIWAFNRPPTAESVTPVEFIELPGGEKDGAIDETLRVDSPEDVVEDASITEETTEDQQVEEVLENVLELADQAAQQVQQQFDVEAANSGKSGSATGTGRRALGMGPGDSGMPREQRWFVRFSSTSSLDTYAKQLDYFGIELGALTPDGRLIYVSNLSNATPTAKVTQSGKGESRLYMTWRGGQRRKADLELFAKAGYQFDDVVLFHFYSKMAESRLAELELEYANRDVKEIRRTYFVVRRSGNEYDFEVTRQTYFQ